MKYIFGVFSERRKTSEISSEELLWCSKDYLEGSVLLWDLENIPFNRLGDIKKLVRYTPQDLYLIVRYKVSQEFRDKVAKEGFKILNAHKTISDDKIIKMMKLFRNKTYMILISSDADFAREANHFMKKGKFHWIVMDNSKKRVLMKVNLASPNLYISTLHQLENEKRRANRQKKKIPKKRATFKQVSEDDDAQSLKKPIQYRVFRINHRRKRVQCGKIIQHEGQKKCLMLQRSLMKKYEMPHFPKEKEFSDNTEIEHLVMYNEKDMVYELRRFKRMSGKNI